jgi:Uma2 family endonuclease
MAPAVLSARGGEQVAVLPRARRFTVEEFERMVQAGVFAAVRVQGPVRFRSLRSRPQPDLALLEPRPDYYADGAPGAEEILLLIEVMDTSVKYDRRRKAPLYARAGVSELWLIDLPAGVVDVHREPSAVGYRDIRTLRRGEALTLRRFPDVILRVDDVLG